MSTLFKTVLVPGQGVVLVQVEAYRRQHQVEFLETWDLAREFAYEEAHQGLSLVLVRV